MRSATCAVSGCAVFSPLSYAEVACDQSRPVYLTDEPIPVEFTYPVSEGTMGDAHPEFTAACSGAPCTSRVVDVLHDQKGSSLLVSKGDLLRTEVTPTAAGTMTVEAQLSGETMKPRSWTFGPFQVKKVERVEIACTYGESNTPCTPTIPLGEPFSFRIGVFTDEGQRVPTSHVETTLDGQPFLSCHMSATSPDRFGPAYECVFPTKLASGPRVFVAKHGAIERELKFAIGT